MKSLSVTVRCWLVLLILCHQSLSDVVPNQVVNNTLTIGFLVSFESEWLSGPFIASAIILGIEEVKRRELLPGYEIEWRWANSGCDTLLSFRGAIDIWQRSEDLDVLVGPACSVGCDPVSFLADIWNIPIISYGCFGPNLSDKSLYPTFTRSVQTGFNFVPILSSIAQVFGWQRVAIITSTQAFWAGVSLLLREILEKQGVHVFYHAMKSTMVGDQVDQQAMAAQQQVVKSLKDEARIIFVMCYPTDLRNFLVTCHDEAMLNGDYVFIGNDVIDVPDLSFTYRPEVGMEIFTGFLTVELGLIESPEWNTFRYAVLEAFDTPEFDSYPTLSTNDSIDDVMVYAGFLQDAVLMWGYGVNATLEAGGSVDDGRAITQNILGLQFESVTGEVAISENGDRLLDSKVYSMQPLGKDILLLYWSGAASEMISLYSNTTPSEWQGIPWAVSSYTVPSDSPVCGWEGELCIVTSATSLVPLGSGVAACSGIILIGAIILVVHHRNMRRQLKLKKTMALVLEEEDVIVVGVGDQRVLSTTSYRDGKDEDSISRQPSRMDDDTTKTMAPVLEEEDVIVVGVGDQRVLSTTSYRDGKDEDSISRQPSRMDDDTTEVNFTFNPAHQHTDNISRVSYSKYQDRPIVIHTFKFESSQNEMLKLLGEMRELNCDNLNPFHGALLLGKNIKTTYDYAPKKCIQTLIEDGQFQLTWDIKISLLSDITAGLIYLARSVLTGHGHFSSTNCVVDSRWVCKITDYGFLPVHQVSLMSPLRKLWCPPEVLRTGVMEKPLSSLDVYSLGIIVQELLSETPPYSITSEDDIDMIVSQVRDGCSPPRRPDLSCTLYPASWVELATSCWQEDPQKRPTPQEARSALREINGGRLPRLIDDMIERLEAHTLHLGEVVAERSFELAQEKDKMEALLRELLPPSVADCLKTGERMEPTMHESVTLMFTDIVGFTRVCSMSNPMQVVSMLNKLYSKFDSILDHYDVYKVATIGDAYMVASGVPTPNGDQHASEIALASLALIDSMNDFTVSHLPDARLLMRVGLHSGSCVAGVTGVKMPRYSLFGDTIDIAARVEAGGEAMRVHATQTTVDILQRGSLDFKPEYHAEMNINGTIFINTYWLLDPQPRDT